MKEEEELVEEISRATKKLLVKKKFEMSAKQNIRSSVYEFLSAFVSKNAIQDFKTTPIITLWESMSEEEKTKWTIFNVIRSELGDVERLKIDTYNEILFEKINSNNEEFDEEEYESNKQNYPNYLEQEPSRIWVYDIMINPIMPITHIKAEFKINKHGS